VEKISRIPPKNVDLEVDTRGEDLRGRSCESCACSFVIKRPTLQPAGMKKEQFDALRDMRVCRLNPPMTVPTPNSQVTYFQQPVYDNNVCWHWRTAGSLPGEDNHETNWRLAREAPPLAAGVPEKPVCMAPRGSALCTLDKGHSGLHYSPDAGHW